jgi:sulfur carrier protein
MKVLIRNPRRRTVDIAGPKRVEQVLRELALSAESHLVIRGEEVLTRDEMVGDTEEIEILSAISGGLGCAA